LTEVLSTAVAFIVILGILVFFHELGHFTAAKTLGMKVEEFAELLGVNIKTYYSWESGKTTPNMKEGFRIAEILNRDLTKIWHPVKGAFFNS
jgi:DNA-binding XRE family transcriptional regulator